MYRGRPAGETGNRRMAAGGRRMANYSANALVVPAEAGTHSAGAQPRANAGSAWVPAFAGTTAMRRYATLCALLGDQHQGSAAAHAIHRELATDRILRPRCAHLAGAFGPPAGVGHAIPALARPRP